MTNAPKKVPCKHEDDRQVFHADLPQQFVFWSKEQLFALQVLIAQTCLRPFCVPFHASTPDDAILVQPEISFFFLYTRYNLYTHHQFIYTITYIFLTNPICKLFTNYTQKYATNKFSLTVYYLVYFEVTFLLQILKLNVLSKIFFESMHSSKKKCKPTGLFCRHHYFQKSSWITFFNDLNR